MFNFIKSSKKDSDTKLFFGPIDNSFEKTFEIEDNWSMANIVHLAGIFPSISQARKNGWNKEIPNGFSEFKVGKTKVHIAIFKEV